MSDTKFQSRKRLYPSFTDSDDDFADLPKNKKITTKETNVSKSSVSFENVPTGDTTSSVPKLSRKRTLKRSESTSTSNSDDVVPRKILKPKCIRFLDNDVRKNLVRKLSEEFNIQMNISDLLPTDADDQSNTFWVHDVYNDGNSLYRSISFLLFETEKYFSVIRKAVIHTMKTNKHIFDKECACRTSGKYLTIDSYLKETRADKSGRINNIFLTLQAIAVCFKTPVYLFTIPVNERPTAFLPKQNQVTGTSFVLFGLNKYIRPVLKFNGENFEHKFETFNPNKIQIQNTETSSPRVRKSFAVEKLTALSKRLVRESLKTNPFVANVTLKCLTLLEKFVNGYYDEVELNSELFIFACKWEAFSLIDFMLSQFMQSGDVLILAQFIEDVCLREKTTDYVDELITHFRDVCHNAVDQELKRIQSTNEKVAQTVADVLKCRSQYTVATVNAMTYLNKKEFMFKDIFPHTVLYLDWKKKRMWYFTGIKSSRQQWIPLAVNRRIFEEIKISNSRHIIFDGPSLYAYVGMRNGCHQICYMKNIFNHQNNLEFCNISEHTTSMPSLQMVKSNKNDFYLVDVKAHKVYDLREKEWLKVDDWITVRSTKDCELCIITKSSDSKKYISIVKQGVKQHKLFGSFTEKQNVIQFKYSVSGKDDHLFIKRRLGDDQLYFDESRHWEESNILKTNDELFAHYIVPRPENYNETDSVFSLIATNCLNHIIMKQQFPSREFRCDKLIDSVLKSQTHMPQLFQLIGIPENLEQDIKKQKKLEKSSRENIIKCMLEEWYIAVRNLEVNPNVAGMLLTSAYNALRTDLLSSAYKTLHLEETCNKLTSDSVLLKQIDQTEGQLKETVKKVKSYLSKMFSDD